MIVSLGTQTGEFLWAGGVGLGMGLLYSLGRGVRRACPGMTVPVDGLFAIVYFLTLLLMAVYTGGLELYQVLGTVLGAGLWFLTMGPPLERLLGVLFRKIRRAADRAGSFLKKTLKFLQKSLKKFFPSSGKWGTIDVIPFYPLGNRRKKGAVPHGKKMFCKASGYCDGTLVRRESGHSGSPAALRRR